MDFKLDASLAFLRKKKVPYLFVFSSFRYSAV